jgi:beta-glucosidase
LNTAVGNSTAGALRVTAVDHAAQEDARLANWSGAATLALQSEGEPIDLQREANGQLSLVFDYRVDAEPAAAVTLGVECGARCRGDFPIDGHLRKAPRGEWRQLKVLLQCFQKSGADLRNVTSPFVLTSAGKLQLAFANVRLDSGLEGAIGCE